MRDEIVTEHAESELDVTNEMYYENTCDSGKGASLRGRLAGAVAVITVVLLLAELNALYIEPVIATLYAVVKVA